MTSIRSRTQRDSALLEADPSWGGRTSMVVDGSARDVAQEVSEAATSEAAHRGAVGRSVLGLTETDGAAVWGELVSADPILTTGELDGPAGHGIGTPAAFVGHDRPSTVEAAAGVTMSAFGDRFWQGIAAGQETTDAPATDDTSYALAIGQSFYGAISSSTDQDWIAVELVAGQAYDFRLLGMGANFLGDPLLRLMNSAGVELASNDDGFTSNSATHEVDSRLVFTATTTGTHYLVADAFSTETGGYLLSATLNNPSGMVFTADEIAWQLVNNGMAYFGAPQAARFNVGVDEALTVNLTALTGDGQFLARQALLAWSAVTNINFTETAGAAEITFDDNQSGAFAEPVTSGGFITSSTVNVGLDWLNSFGTTLNSYSFETYIHEIGHALGLGHGGNYNGSADYGTDNFYLNDGLAWSIMSYMQADNDEFDGGGPNDWNTFLDASFRYMMTPMIADIIAIQYLYGVSSEFTGDTVWGFGGTTGVTAIDTAVNQGALMAMTVYDTGGMDTLNLSGTSQAQIISLAAESMSSVLGGRHNLSIARGVTIENAVGGSGSDVITGNQAANALSGGDGADTLTGGAGNDALDGGAGSDTAIFSGARSAYTITNVGFQFTVTGPDGTDTLTQVEFAQFADQTLALTVGPVVNGTAAGETINGTAVAETLNGLGGNDTIFGGAGQDMLNGGEGNDTLVGNADIFAQESDVLNGEAGDDLIYAEFTDVISGGAGFDSLIAINSFNFTLDMAATSIEYAVMDFGNDTVNAAGQTVGVSVFASGGTDSVTGSGFNDLIFGGSGDDVLTGGNGDDAIVGEVGADQLSGGEGADRIYFDAQDTLVSGGNGYDAGYITVGNGTGVVINLGTASLEFIQDTAGGNDLIQGGTMTVGLTAYAGGGADVVQGSAFNDVLWGEAGDDVMSGAAGNDTLVGGAGADVMNGGLGRDSLYGGAGDGVQDRFRFTNTGAANWDYVIEFTLGQDKIDLSALAGVSFANVSIVTSGGSSDVFVNGQQACRVVGVVGLTASDFLFAGAAPADPGDLWIDKGPLVLPDDTAPLTPGPDWDAGVQDMAIAMGRPSWMGRPMSQDYDLLSA